MGCSGLLMGRKWVLESLNTKNKKARLGTADGPG